MASSLPDAAAFDPLIDFFLFEFPEAKDLVGRHVLFAYTLVGGVAFDALTPCVLIKENLILSG